MRGPNANGRQRIPEDVRGACSGRRRRGRSRGLLLATHLHDLRLHALELGKQRGRLAFQR